MVATDFDRERAYSDDQFTAREVFRNDRLKVVLGFFEPGQFIPVHAPDSDVVLVVRTGRGTVRDGDADREVSEGSVVIVSAGEARGVRAVDERLEATLAVAPPPADEDHELVREGLRADEFDPR